MLEYRHPVFILLALVGVVLSALYMARLTFTTFFGDSKTDHSGVHESSSVMTVPLLLLAVPAVAVGFFAFGLGDSYKGFAGFIDGHSKFHFNVLLTVVSLVLAGIGIWVGWAAYIRGSISTERVIARFQKVHHVLAARYYVDRVVVNDTGVDGSADSVKISGFRMKFVQTGRIYNYGMAMAAGVIALSLIWWIVLT